jgi:hypothetical protein
VVLKYDKSWTEVSHRATRTLTVYINIFCSLRLISDNGNVKDFVKLGTDVGIIQLTVPSLVSSVTSEGKLKVRVV